MSGKADTDKAILMTSFARMDPVALAVALGSIWALILMFATFFLLFKGSFEGYEVGRHLMLLHIYLPGYQVTWAGGLLGAAYMFVIGGITGFILAVLWNLTHYIYVVMIVIRSAWWRMMAD